MTHTDHRPELPVTAEGIGRFLSSDMVEGIGPAYARKLVESFGADTLGVMADEPERCRLVKGLGEARALKASESIRAIRQGPRLPAGLFSCGVSEMFVERILGKYGMKAEEVVRADPYWMVEDVWQLSLFTADRIGRALGIAPDDPRRLRGALVEAVKHFAERGHLFASADEAVEEAASMTGVDREKIEAQIGAAVDSGRLVRSRGGLYLPVFHKAEKDAAERLRELAAGGSGGEDFSDIPASDGRGLKYSPAQLEAIRLVLASPVAVLTGGPGSGKTTVLRAVIDVLERQGRRVTLVAPTGRAAKRMSTLTGREASTIHRLLGYHRGEGYRRGKIDTDVLIIDEGSMMEQVLFNHLLQCVGPATRVLLVGDADQLPAIGAGDVMRDMIASAAIPVAVLDENFRQRQGSRIAEGARAINSGVMPPSHPDGDLVIIPEPSVGRIHRRILSLVADEIPAQRGIPSTDILVVTPQQVGPLGARQLNIDIRERVNPSGPELRRGDTIMRLGDPVMQTANSRERGVYNGETGRIVKVDTEGATLTVEFADGRSSIYTRSELSELTPAYATTVHKLQGSEAPNIIFPVTMAHRPMLYRNLLYTGVSRASRLCILVGEEEALLYAIANTPDASRNSNFKHRLKGA